MIEIENLQVGYDEKIVIDGLNLRIDRGFTAILGPNGSGKTTLLRSISGILKPLSGSVKILGRDIYRISRREVSKIITMISQDFVPMYDYTALDVVKMAFSGRGFFPSKEEEDLAIEALKSVGMKHLKERMFSTLSGGEKRLVMIARALAQGSKVILVDELELHLDPLHKKQIARVLTEISRTGKTVISVFHDIQLAFSFADRFIGIRSGTVQFDSEKPNLEDLERLFDMEFREVDGVIIPWYTR